MKTLDLKNMNISEKVKMMEDLWEELSKNESYITPAWHLDELEKREKEISEDKSEFIDIKDVKELLSKNENKIS
jgi:hypothetical protein